MTDFVYFTECADTIKIGYSNNPQARARSLRGTVLAVAPGGRGLEARVHRRFDHLGAERIPRPGGADTEHFRKDPELLEFIRRIVSGEDLEAMLIAEARAKEAAAYAQLVESSRGVALWLQARVVLTYEQRNYVYGGYVDHRDAIQQIHEVETAWECLDAGACSCLCHTFAANSPIRTGVAA